MNKLLPPMRKLAAVALSCCGCWTGLGAPASSLAQDAAEVTAPTPPLVAKPEKAARWKVRLTPASGGPAPEEQAALSPEIREIISTRTGELIQVKFRWSNGSDSESWLAEGYALEAPPEYPTVLVTPPGVQRSRLLPAASQFPGVEWLDLKYFQAVVTFEGKRCFHYREPENQLEAWVEVKTNLPVAAADAAYRYHYHFLPQPEVPLVLPEKFRAALKDYQLAASR